MRSLTDKQDQPAFPPSLAALLFTDDRPTKNLYSRTFLRTFPSLDYIVMKTNLSLCQTYINSVSSH